MGNFSINPMQCLWKFEAPPRVPAFSLVAIQGGILTMENLRGHRMTVVNMRLMCLADAETADPLS